MGALGVTTVAPAPVVQLAVAVLLLAQVGPSLAALRSFEWNISYATIAPDCVTKTVPTINGAYPGPEIYAVMGDRIRVKVCNNHHYGVAIHWHGMHMKGQQWMDGPAHGALCPIEYDQCFTYDFRVVGQHGTYWYHSHIELQRTSIYGALIIWPRKNAVVPFPKPTGELTMLLNDWYHRYSGDIQTGLKGKPWQFIGAPNSFLINGRGLTYCKIYACPYPFNPKKCGTCDRSSKFCNPLSTFVVERGGTYRIRLVNVGLWAQMNFAIEGHTFKMVMADGHYLEQVEHDSIDINPGQAFDILVTFDQEPRNYWVAINGRYDNLGIDPPGLAVIKYKGNKWFDQPQPYTAWPTGPDYTDLTFGPFQQLTFKNYYTVPGLKDRKVDKYYSMMWNMNLIDGFIRYSVNNQSFYRSTTPLLAAEYFNISGAFKPSNDLPDHFDILENEPVGLQPAEYATNILTIQKGQFVQIVLQNHSPPGGNHPWHLHGHDFYVVGYGEGVYDRSKEAEYEKTYNLINPPLRNMVTVYEGMWFAIRFEANNAGLWNMHCHMEPHMELGMQLFVRVVGDPTDIPPPPEGIPMCGRLLQLNITGGVTDAQASTALP